MKIRRFVGKRRRRAAKRFSDLMSAKHVGADDRQELSAFRKYLRGGMSRGEEHAYALGESVSRASVKRLLAAITTGSEPDC